jgi:SAM-dependent MidA family methyltransferase
VVIANEVLDAMPAKRLINQTDGFKELGVGCQDDLFIFF